MTSIRRLKMAAGAGDPDSVPAQQLDVVLAAEKWFEANKALQKDDRTLHWNNLDTAEHELEQAVRRLRNARRKRGRI